jgi:epoxyqueuosine reductase
MTTCSEILLHCCCGPCSMACIDFLRNQGFSIKPIFFNPNIEPIDENKRRLEGFLTVCNFKGLEPIVISDDLYIQKTDDNRCGHCYSFRLDKVAQFANRNGFAQFTTTLLISPYQNHELLRQTGEKHKTFKYFDFRSFFRDSQNQAKELGIYRQKYCGCLISLEESIQQSKKAQAAKQI